MTVITSITPAAGLQAGPSPSSSVFFTRAELMEILNIYGRMVAAGRWRDYSIDSAKTWIGFSAYKRASEMPEFQIIKEPALAKKAATYRLVNSGGQVLKRGPDLKAVLKPLEAKWLKWINRD